MEIESKLIVDKRQRELIYYVGDIFKKSKSGNYSYYFSILIEQCLSLETSATLHTMWHFTTISVLMFSEVLVSKRGMCGLICSAIPHQNPQNLSR